jgi:hypothetical protein
MSDDLQKKVEGLSVDEKKELPKSHPNVSIDDNITHFGSVFSVLKLVLPHMSYKE